MMESIPPEYIKDINLNLIDKDDDTFTKNNKKFNIN
jgi:hypothetical protein